MFLSLYVSMCLCLCICLFVTLRLSHYHHQMISFQKIYGLYGLEHHTVEINGDVTMETDGPTSEYRATQSVDTVRLSSAIPKRHLIWFDQLSVRRQQFYMTDLPLEPRRYSFSSNALEAGVSSSPESTRRGLKHFYRKRTETVCPGAQRKSSIASHWNKCQQNRNSALEVGADDGAHQLSQWGIYEPNNLAIDVEVVIVKEADLVDGDDEEEEREHNLVEVDVEREVQQEKEHSVVKFMSEEEEGHQVEGLVHKQLVIQNNICVERTASFPPVEV